MLYFNVCLILIEGVWLYFDKRIEYKNKLKFFYALTCVQAILLSGLRHIHVGMDTYNYMNIFERVKDYRWDYILEMFHPQRILSGVDIEPGFYLSIKIFQIFSNSFRLYLIAFACFVNIPIFHFFYKRSKNAPVSVLIYMCLYWAFVSTTGMRQTMALMIVTVFAYTALEKRKPLRYFLLVLLAMLFHRSALICLPFYFISKVKISRLYIVAVLILTSILYIYRIPYTGLIMSVGGWYTEYGDQYASAGAFNFSFIMVVMAVCILFLLDQLKRKSPHCGLIVNALLMSLILLPTTFVDPSNLRAVFYFSFYITLLVPDMIDSFSDAKSKTITCLAVIMLLCLLFFRGDHTYRFLWQPGIYNDLPSIV